MDVLQALSVFSALSQQTRLDVFRLLIQAGDQGMLAGEIAEKLDVRQNTMSANLSVLLNSGLANNQRQGRAIRYFANMDAVRGLLEFLMADCCGGQPEQCRSALDILYSANTPTQIEPNCS